MESEFLVRIRREIERVFARIEAELTATAGSGAVPVPVDVYETPEEVVLFLDVPGCERADLSVEVGRGCATIRGVKRPPETRGGAVRCQERRFGEFSLSIPLPANADTRHAVAALRGGQLTLRIARVAERRGGMRVIEISE